MNFMNTKVIVFGTGGKCEKWIQNLLEIDNDTEIVCFVDNNKEKWNSLFRGKEVLPPEEVKKHENVTIVIASSFYKEISKQLSVEYGVDKGRIVTVEEYYRFRYTKKKYFERYGQNLCEEPKKIKGKIAVYTANIGKYDTLLDPRYVDDSIDYYCYTDDKDYSSKVWKTIYLDENDKRDNALRVRELKFFPEHFLPEYEYSIWVDSKFDILGSLKEYAERYLKEQDLLLFPHFQRDCIYDEAVACIKCNKGNPIILGGQIYEYYNQGFPKHSGLYECGCIVRRHGSRKVQEIMQKWWDEINRYSQRDQIALPYIFWKENYNCDICDMDINRCEYLKVKVHNEK